MSYTRTFHVVAMLCCFALSGAAQDHREAGGWFLYWGYNRAGYSLSDIHLSGPGYDVTFRQVKADDRPENPSVEYVKPSTFTIPQYNYRLGWFFRRNWSLSLGMDHMKYVVAAGQTVTMEGSIAPERSDHFTLDHTNREVELSPDLLRYEHTDGLNLLSVDLDRYQLLWKSASGQHQLSVFEGLHAGAVIPRTDVRIFGDGVNNAFHLAGFGVGGQGGLHLTLWNHFLVRATGRAGWMDLPDVLTTGTAEDRADQQFWFWQGNLTIGAQFRLGAR